MLHRVRDLRRKTAALVESVGEEWQQTIENVFVEDFEIHVRILVEFFAKPEPREDRARLVHAVDFLGAAQEANWRRKHVSSNEEQELDRLWDLVSEHALHPMRSRTHDRDKKKIDFDATVALLDRLATAFVFAPGVFKKLSRRRDWSRWHSRVVVDPR
ncbi:MAG TPA: hypothetical protein VH165_14340 [Kofleriaceae bacterium]|nr:hypothetical protein [Kofleriaceae bacterium]